eukprot:76011-Amphidinium_carterae.1
MTASSRCPHNRFDAPQIAMTCCRHVKPDTGNPLRKPKENPNHWANDELLAPAKPLISDKRCHKSFEM